jgi:hypothetical protein
MSTVRKLRSNQKELHIEAEGCVINIREGLTDLKEREVTSIEILPDNHCCGERIWKLIGSVNNRIIKLKKIKH